MPTKQRPQQRRQRCRRCTSKAELGTSSLQSLLIARYILPAALNCSSSLPCLLLSDSGAPVAQMRSAKAAAPKKSYTHTKPAQKEKKAKKPKPAPMMQLPPSAAKIKQISLERKLERKLLKHGANNLLGQENTAYCRGAAGDQANEWSLPSPQWQAVSPLSDCQVPGAG